MGDWWYCYNIYVQVHIVKPWSVFYDTTVQHSLFTWEKAYIRQHDNFSALESHGLRKEIKPGTV